MEPTTLLLGSGALSGPAFRMTFRVRVRVRVRFVTIYGVILYCAQSAGPDNTPVTRMYPSITPRAGTSRNTLNHPAISGSTQLVAMWHTWKFSLEKGFV